MPVKHRAFWRTSLKSGVAILPLAIMFAQMPASAQPKTQAQLEAEAAAAKAAAASGSDADDARAIAELTGGKMGTSISSQNNKDIVVTGTNIRGVAPTGTNVVSMTKEDIAATGQTSGTALLAQLPQLGDFNSIAAPTTTSNGFMNRPNARGLPNDSLDTGPSTLVLIDGNRTSSVGGRQNVVDLDAIPVATLERVEVNTDGGSAVSGSDAIGGTINFVTRRKFDGLQVGGHFGYADDYSIYDANILAGKQWSNGGFYVAVSRGGNKALLNKDRSFVQIIDWSTGLQTGTGCELPNVIFAASTATSGTTFTAPTRYYPIQDGTIKKTQGLTVPALATSDQTGTAHVPSGANLCTMSRYASYDPKRLRNNANFVGNYDFSDSLELTVKGRYADSLNHFINTPPGFTATVTPNNPFYQAITATPGYTQLSNTQVPSTSSDAGKNQSVSGSYLPAVGADFVPSINKYKQYGSTLELVWRVDGNWQVKATGIWDQSATSTQTRSANATISGNAQSTATGITTTTCQAASATWFALAAGAAKDAALAAAQKVCINPYNIASSDQALIKSIFTNETAQYSTDRIYNAKVVVDGALFTMPGGKVRVALSAEYYDEKLSKRFCGCSGAPFGSNKLLPKNFGLRTVVSGSAEVNVPLVSSANALTWIKELRVRAAARYDHYTFFGSTFNPQLGVTFKPTNWLNLSGNISTAFRAPTVLDLLGNGNGIPLTTQIYADNKVARNPNLPDPDVCPPVNGQGCLVSAIYYVLNGGAAPGISPQTGRDWSIAAEVTPFRGFRARVSYYHIDYRNAISAPNITSFNSFSPFAIWYPTTAQINEFLSASSDPGAFANESRPVYALVDLRSRNFGNSKIAGIDYSARYNSSTPWGSVFVSVSGNIKLENKNQGTSTQTINGKPTLVLNASFLDQFGSSSRHGMTAQVGTTYNGLRGTFTLNHTDGYRLVGTQARSFASPQDRVADFNVINAAFSYDFTSDGPIERGLQLSLNINNLLNTSPPLRMSGSGTANGKTIGRLIQAGFNKKF